MSKGGSVMTARKAIISFVTVAALAVTASIPAASIFSSAGRPVLDRIASPQVAESLTLQPRAYAASDLPAVGAGRVRIVVESDAPASATVAIEAAGGRVERSWRDLIQAAVPRSAGSGAERDRRRRRSRTDAHAAGCRHGEEVTAASRRRGTRRASPARASRWRSSTVDSSALPTDRPRATCPRTR